MIKSNELISFYKDAKKFLIGCGFGEEMRWQAMRSPKAISEAEFLREAAWVIYCSGFKEAIVRKRFDYLSLCFFDWCSANEIVDAAEACVSSALLGIRNRRKHLAVIDVARHVVDAGFDQIKAEFLLDPLPVFQRMPYLGPVTSVHLAKNLGFAVAKPDRHLVRLGAHFGYGDVGVMCRSIADATGDPVTVVDLVLWRCMEREAATVTRLGARKRNGTSGTASSVAV